MSPTPLLPDQDPFGVDITTPNVARMYDYYLGGKDHFQADRDAAERVLTLIPGLRHAAQENRRFQRRVVRYLAGEAGIAQFLDIGVGLPTQGAVHEVAHEVNPDARVVYADYDPVVVSHGRALLADGGRSVMVRGDVRQPGELLGSDEVRGHLDFSRPVAVSLFAVLHFIPDTDYPRHIIATIANALAPGSYLALSHIGTEFFSDKEAMAKAARVYEEASERAFPRPRTEIEAFFDGFELIEPGLVPKHEWRPGPGGTENIPNIQWGGVGRKTAP
jgi:SAM-dependent methyltransferase